MIIRHSQGAYEVVICSAPELLHDLPESSFVITDDNVRRVVAEIDLPAMVLPPGEGSKRLSVYESCLEWLAQKGATRQSAIVGLGGGVIGDLAGFVAATYMRGVPFVQIPTTLLAQVDSSVGGKVGLDLMAGKNLVGAFYPPKQVRLCLDLLKSLPERQFVAGMAEVWKYGAIMDESLFSALERSPLDANSAQLREVVMRCIQLKAKVVEEDEFETTGYRAILNFGHTVAHAIETLTGYGPVLHGEAVAIGMVVETRLGERLGITPSGNEERLTRCLHRQGLPTDHPVLSQGDAMIAAMKRDKKSIKGDLAFSLLTHMGGCKLVQGVAEGEVRAALANT